MRQGGSELSLGMEMMPHGLDTEKSAEMNQRMDLWQHTGALLYKAALHQYNPVVLGYGRESRYGVE